MSRANEGCKLRYINFLENHVERNGSYNNLQQWFKELLWGKLNFC